MAIDRHAPCLPARQVMVLSGQQSGLEKNFFADVVETSKGKDDPVAELLVLSRRDSGLEMAAELLLKVVEEKFHEKNECEVGLLLVERGSFPPADCSVVLRHAVEAELEPEQLAKLVELIRAKKFDLDACGGDGSTALCLAVRTQYSPLMH